MSQASTRHSSKPSAARAAEPPQGAVRPILEPHGSVSILALAAAYYAAFIYRASFVIGSTRYFPLLDDAMVSMRYARHLVQGHGFVWNAGDAPLHQVLTVGGVPTEAQPAEREVGGRDRHVEDALVVDALALAHEVALGVAVRAAQDPDELLRRALVDERLVDGERELLDLRSVRRRCAGVELSDLRETGDGCGQRHVGPFSSLGPAFNSARIRIASTFSARAARFSRAARARSGVGIPRCARSGSRRARVSVARDRGDAGGGDEGFVAGGETGHGAVGAGDDDDGVPAVVVDGLQRSGHLRAYGWLAFVILSATGKYETYIGRKKGTPKKRGYQHKQMVLSLVDRESGKARSIVVNEVTAKTIAPIVRANVAKEARLMTDEAGIYVPIGRQFAEHHVLRHNAGEYGRGEAHTNTIEGFWAHVSRSLRGTHVWVSKKHLQTYLREFEYRHNLRHSPSEMISRLLGRFPLAKVHP